MVLEYARNVLHYAQYAEYDPYASTLFVSHLACSLAGCEMELTFESGSWSCRDLRMDVGQRVILMQLRSGPVQGGTLSEQRAAH